MLTAGPVVNSGATPVAFAPRPGRVVVLGLLCNGLGHLYTGRLGLAVAVHLLWLSTVLMAVTMLRVGPGATLLALVVMVVFFLGQAWHARVIASRAAPGPRPLPSRVWALIAFYVATTVIAQAAWPVRGVVAHPAYVPGGSMIPTIQVGDVIAIASGKPAVLRGAVVEIAAPRGWPRPEPLLKRIVGVAGDLVELRDGALWLNGKAVPRTPGATECGYTVAGREGWRDERCVDFVEVLNGRAYHVHCTPGVPCGDLPPQRVPEGQVWLAGDHRDHSADSRVFGPVPESTILGEVRWVIFSWGPTGLRVNRTGTRIR